HLSRARRARRAQSRSGRGEDRGPGRRGDAAREGFGDTYDGRRVRPRADGDRLYAVLRTILSFLVSFIGGFHERTSCEGMRTVPRRRAAAERQRINRSPGEARRRLESRQRA